MKRFTKALSMLLAIVMVVGLLPLSIIADDVQSTHTVEFKLNYNGAHKIPSQKVADGECAVQPEDVTRTGWIFEYWYEKTGDGIQKFDLSQPITEDVTLYARWDEDINFWGSIWGRNILGAIERAEEETEPVTYTVTFDGNGSDVENVPAALTVNEGECAVEPAAPTRNGYIFDGWYTDAECTIAYDFTTAITANITLYAQWIETMPEGTYRVSFNSNGGTPVEGQWIQSGSTAIQPVDPVKAESRFIAWYSDEELTSVWDFATPVTIDITLYAKWEAVIEDSSILDIPNPEVEIYSFDINTRRIVVGETVLVTFTSEIFTEYMLEDGSVKVYENDVVLGTMNDSGINGDSEAYDGIYTLQLNLSSDVECYNEYYVKVDTFTSEVLGIGYYIPMSNEEIELMRDVDEQIQNLFTDEEFINLSYEEKLEVISELLNALEESGMIAEDTIFYDEITKTIYFDYANGVNGGVSLQEHNDMYNAGIADENTDVEAVYFSTDSVSVEKNVIIYNGFENTSYRRNFYNRLKSKWDDIGLNTTIDLDVTVNDFMNNLDNANNDVIVFAMHGSKYSENRSETRRPVFCINEVVTADTDRDYSYELNTRHSIARVIVNGSPMYFVKALLLTDNYSRTSLDGKLIFSESCMFYGCDCQSTTPDRSLANTFVGLSTEAVVGYHNSVGADYSRDVMKMVIEDTFDGETIGTALNNARNAYGVTDDWEDISDDKYEAYPLIAGNSQYVLRSFGAIAGLVKNAETNNGIKNALIRVYNEDGDEIASTRTDATGSYSLDVPAGKIIVKVSAGLYKTVKMEVTVNEGQTTYNETFLLLSVNIGILGYANGIITNSITGAAVPDVTIKLRLNWNNKNGIVLDTVSTNANGYYEITAPSGFYTIEYYKSGYITGYKNIRVGDIGVAGQNAVISPVTSSDTYRIVLTWGSTPSDLDSHLVGPTADGGKFHVYYSDKTHGSEADLDIDDTSSYGPETITIHSFNEGIYTYAIHDYSNRSSSYSTAMANSGAQVKVYRGAELLKTYNVPANMDGTLWTVFTYNPATKQITTVNTMSYDSSSGGSLMTAAEPMMLMSASPAAAEPVNEVEEYDYEEIVMIITEDIFSSVKD